MGERSEAGRVGWTQSLVGEEQQKEAVRKAVNMYGFCGLVMRVM